MFDILIKISSISLPVYVFLLMFNVGLTQNVHRILHYLKDSGFGIRMFFANFILAPLLMWGMLELFPIDSYLGAGLTIFSLCAGAPFLIKLAQMSKHNLALGASTMIGLVLATVVLVPFLLPVFVPGIQINSLKIGLTLLKQLLFPLMLGALSIKFLPAISLRVQPLVAKVANVALYVVLASTLIGYYPELSLMFGEGAILMGVVFILGAFGIGYLLGIGRKDHIQEIAALGTAQRNTAASMIIAYENFPDHPSVLVIITTANTLGIIMLIFVAKFFSKNNKVRILDQDKSFLRRAPKNL